MLTWLHISDLHFKASESYDANVVLQALLTDIKSHIKDKLLILNFIIVSGDIAFSGNPLEYDLAKKFFDDLLKYTNVPKKLLFLVPGNHDVDRSQVTSAVKSIESAVVSHKIADSLLSNDKDRLYVSQRFHNYKSFIEEYFCDTYTKYNDKNPFYVENVIIDGLTIAILCFNSAILSSSDDDRAKLIIGERTVRNAIDKSKSANLRLAVMHHPLDWLRDFDHKEVKPLLFDNCHFILHGHMHETSIIREITPDSNAIVIAAGACYETREYPNSYNFVTINLDDGQGMIYLRRYSNDQGGFWTEDVMSYRKIKNGKYKFQLPNIATTPLFEVTDNYINTNGQNKKTLMVYRDWAINYKRNLALLQTDLKMIIDSKIDIYIAIDFYDIYDYCFPQVSFMHDKKTRLDNKSWRNNYVKRQLSRSVLFFLSDFLYAKPILLLPPYLREYQDSLKVIISRANRYVNLSTQRDFFIHLINEFSQVLESSEGMDETDKLINIFSTKGSDLAFFFSSLLISDLDILDYLMRHILSADLSSMVADLSEDPKEKLDSIACSIINDGNKRYKELLQSTRFLPAKRLQNDRDAEAIRYTMELNNNTEENKKSIFLVSSAEHMNRVLSLHSITKKLSLDGQDYSFVALRSLDYLYILMLEISRYIIFKKQGKKLEFIDKMTREELLNLSESIESDITTLDRFICADSDIATIGSSIGEEIAEQNIESVIKLNEEINNIDFTLLISKILPEENNINHKILNIFDPDESIREITNIFRSIRSIASNNELMDKIAQRGVELELKRLDLLWPLGAGNLQTLYKRLGFELALLEFPFNLLIYDEISDKFVRDILEINNKSYYEIKEKYQISKETLESLYSQLQNLSNQANRIIGDEKYILWQFIFLNLSQYDLLNFWHNQFYKLINKNRVRKELVYLHAVCFMKSIGKYDTHSEDDFKRIINECCEYDIVLLGDIETDLKLINESSLIFIIDKFNISEMSDIILTRLNEDAYAFKDSISRREIAYLLKKDNRVTKLYELDFRLIHLKYLIQNMYMAEYETSDLGPMDEIKNNFLNVLIPISQRLIHDYETSIISDYAYLLAIDEKENYKDNLLLAQRLMIELNPPSCSPYSNYLYHYILGYIYYKLALLEKNNSKEYADKAQLSASNSLKYVHNDTKLKKMILDLINKCELIKNN